MVLIVSKLIPGTGIEGADRAKFDGRSGRRNRYPASRELINRASS